MIGEQIKNIRIKNKLSQSELAKSLYVSRQTIYKWENNKATPTMDNIFQLSTYFSVTSDYFVFNDKEIPSQKEQEISSSIRYKEWFIMITYLFMGIIPFFIVWTVPFSIYVFIFAKANKVKHSSLIRIIALTSIIFFVIQLLTFLVGLFNLTGSTTEIHIN